MQKWILNIRKKLSAHFFKFSIQTSLLLIFPFFLMSFTTDRQNGMNMVAPSGIRSSFVEEDTTKGFVTLLKENSSNVPGTSFEMNARVRPFVEDFIEKHGNQYEKMKSWGLVYLTLYDKILAEHGLPLELKYLSVIESNLKKSALSVAGASGPWQIMPTQARRLGLKVGKGYDERNDYTKSTHAAAKMLKGLYAEFGDWLLVIAAYNAGPGGVAKAIKRAGGSRNFYDIQNYLPQETRNHVKKYIATHYYFEGDGGLTTLTKSETKKYEEALVYEPAEPSLAEDQFSTIEISGRYNSVVIANTLNMDFILFNELNPRLDKMLAEGIPYDLKLPNDKAEFFKTKKQDILRESVQVLFSSNINSIPKIL